MMPIPDIRLIVETALKIHPKECIFRVDTVDYVLEYVNKAAHMRYNRPDLLTEGFYIQMIVDAFKKCEIYCPKEGIDRRAEFQTKI